MWVLSRRLRVEYEDKDLLFKEKNVEDLSKSQGEIQDASNTLTEDSVGSENRSEYPGAKSTI